MHPVVQGRPYRPGRHQRPYACECERSDGPHDCHGHKPGGITDGRDGKTHRTAPRSRRDPIGFAPPSPIFVYTSTTRRSIAGIPGVVSLIAQLMITSGEMRNRSPPP